MKYVIISDIHGNIEALNTVIPIIEGEKPDRIICLGDIVGYGASPSDCLKKIREIADIVVAGNHDFAVCGNTSIEYFNPIAKDAVLWTRKNISQEEIDYLRNLPLTHSENNILFVHSVPSEPQSWEYISTLGDAIEEFSFFTEKICFIGHSHQPAIFYEDRMKRHGIYINERLELREDYRYIINVGSIGQPRDGDPRAAFGILEIDKGNSIFQLKRVPYDIGKAQEKILKNGLPEFLAMRLAMGK